MSDISNLPRITIITPNLDGGRTLERTITSVLAQDYPNLEYMICDGGSSDDSQEIIKRYADKLYFWVSEKDGGQAAAINKGAERATGKIMNWLNSDDFLERGALQKVVKAYESNRQASGWVGGCRRIEDTAKILSTIYPNGLDRENIGQNWNGRQFYQPACFLNLSLFRRVGNLDENLHWAFDLDLWLRLLLEAPLVRGDGIWANALIHHAAKTQRSRRRMAEETILVQKKHGFLEGAANRSERFLKGGKLTYILPESLAKKKARLKAILTDKKETRRERRRLVMISNYLPRYDQTASNLRITNILKIILAQGHSISYFYYARTAKDEDYINFFGKKIQFFCLPLDQKDYLEKITGLEPNLVWMTNLWSLPFLEFCYDLSVRMRERSAASIIIDTMDYHYSKYIRKHNLNGDEKDLKRAEDFLAVEKSLYEIADRVLFVSERDREEAARKLGGAPKMMVLPNVFPLPDKSPPLAGREHICFLGNFEVDHNRDAVGYFNKKILPLIREKDPSLEFHIIGHSSIKYQETLADEGVKIIGKIADLPQKLSTYKIFVCPVTYGAGSKGKIGEAAKAGLPLVSTSIGAEGLLLEDGLNCFIADDPEEFAGKCLHLLEDPIAWHNFSERLRLLIAEKGDPMIIREILDRIIFNRSFSLGSRLLRSGWEEKRKLYERPFEYAEELKRVEEPKISVVIISWRPHPITLRSFNLLEEQRAESFELIFVDNGGRKGKFDTLRPYIDTYVKLNINTGAFRARNIGALFANGPYVLFLDDDCLPDKDLIAAHLKAVEKYEAISVRGVYRPMTDNPLNKLATHYYLGENPFPALADTEGNSVYRADVFYRVGGYDDNISFGHGGAELARRLIEVEADKRKQIYFPEAIIYHDYSVDEKQLKAKRKKQAKTLKMIRRKHHDYDEFIRSWQVLFGREDLLITKAGDRDTRPFSGDDPGQNPGYQTDHQ